MCLFLHVVEHYWQHSLAITGQIEVYGSCRCREIIAFDIITMTMVCVTSVNLFSLLSYYLHIWSNCLSNTSSQYCTQASPPSCVLQYHLAACIYILFKHLEWYTAKRHTFKALVTRMIPTSSNSFPYYHMLSLTTSSCMCICVKFKLLNVAPNTHAI